MLILTRKTGQGFRIGDDIEITITEVSGDKVRVGINAPKEIKVLRSELSETMQQNEQSAHGVDSGALRALARGLRARPQEMQKTAGAAQAGGADGEKKE